MHVNGKKTKKKLYETVRRCRKLSLRVDKGRARLSELGVTQDETEETEYTVEKGRPLSARCRIQR